MNTTTTTSRWLTLRPRPGALVAVDGAGDVWARVSGRGRSAVRHILRLMRGQGWATRAGRVVATPGERAALARWYGADAPRVAAMLATGGEEAHEEARSLAAPAGREPGPTRREAALAAWLIIARARRAGGAQ